MKKKQDQSVAFEICNKFRKTKKSLCIIVDNVRNAQLLKNEISFHIGDDSVEFFPENEILPYDHFSVPESITKRRFHILNKFYIMASRTLPSSRAQTQCERDESLLRLVLSRGGI